MALQQQINRIDHMAFCVYPENFEKAIDKFSRVFGIEFSDIHYNEKIDLKVVVGWDAGIEIIAPLRDDGHLWDQLKAKGEGFAVMVFGVKDIKAAKQQAEANGAVPTVEIEEMIGDEPWFGRFSLFKEVVFEDMFGLTTCLGQIEPKY